MSEEKTDAEKAAERKQAAEERYAQKLEAVKVASKVFKKDADSAKAILLTTNFKESKTWWESQVETKEFAQEFVDFCIEELEMSKKTSSRPSASKERADDVFGFRKIKQFASDEDGNIIDHELATAGLAVRQSIKELEEKHKADLELFETKGLYLMFYIRFVSDEEDDKTTGQ